VLRTTVGYCVLRTTVRERYCRLAAGAHRNDRFRSIADLSSKQQNGPDEFVAPRLVHLRVEVEQGVHVVDHRLAQQTDTGVCT
jgi:hypothetical protein